MSITTLPRLIYISAFSLALGLTSAHVTAGDSRDDHDMNSTSPAQQHDEQMGREGARDARNPGSEEDVRPVDSATDPAGTDAARHVPGAPEKGTNPATEPGNR